jgi:hypothetical protein
MAHGVALAARSVRDEPCEYRVEISREAYSHGPMSWADHGLFLVWRCDEEDAPRHACDFSGAGWCWVPYTQPGLLETLSKTLAICRISLLKQFTDS